MKSITLNNLKCITPYINLDLTAPFLMQVLAQYTKRELLALARKCNLPLSVEGNRKKIALIRILTDNRDKLSLSVGVSPNLPQQTELNL